MGTQQKWMGMIVILATLLLAARDQGMRGEAGGMEAGWGGPRVGIGIGLGPFWGPRLGGYRRPSLCLPLWLAYPPVVAAPSTQVYIQPSPQASVQPPPAASWYYRDNPRGYYPYVQQCPGGWRAVAPTPP